MTTTLEKHQLRRIENIFTKTGIVQQVRHWQHSNMYELDVQVPNLPAEKWQKTPRIICRVAPYKFNDYSPALWDTNNHSFTLYVHAAHEGKGSLWAKKLHNGDAFHYVGFDNARQAPQKDAQHVFIGDLSATGHFNALHQLTHDKDSIAGLMLVKNENEAAEFTDNCPWLNMKPIATTENFLLQIDQTYHHTKADANTIFYLVGNSKLVSAIRNNLKQYGYNTGNIKAQGFWQ